ncbi:unnamed protein product [Symbiodinium necroappetens]|uniref:Peroxisome membrane anchor protein Pex14p N-terminal domain-containing protein n=1 Tax=Symbiodinium necroappetens TaxID=1628268 RepID=A0A812ZYZ1_9DINO|nr:unnamed protein product [Symbiodinium necroappetens]
MRPRTFQALFTRAGCFRAEGRLAEAVDDFATACRYDATLADAKKEWLQAHKELAKATGDHQHFSRVEVLALVAEMNRAHTAVQEAISELGQRLLLAMRERQMEQHLPFLAAHELVRQHGLPADPILDFDLTAEAFQELLGHFEDDDEVMESAQSMLHPPGRGDPARARQITIPQILEAHKVMVQELETLLSQFKNLSAQELDRVDCKASSRSLLIWSSAVLTRPELIEATAELQTYLGVSRLQLQPEDVEEAILTNEMELQNDADFVKCSEAFLQVTNLLSIPPPVPPAFGHFQEDLASLMQELLTAAAELSKKFHLTHKLAPAEGGSREELIEMAVSFLSQTAARPAAEKDKFLADKGLSPDDIQEAYRRLEQRGSGGPGGRQSGPGQGHGPQPPGGPQPSGPQAPTGPAPPSSPLPPRRPQLPAPTYPSPSPGYQAMPPPYPSGSPYQAPPVPPFAMPPMLYQGYPPEPPSGGPWWAWLLGGLGAGLVGTFLVNPFKPEDFNFSEAASWLSDGSLPAPKSAEPLESGKSDPTPQADGKASLEELLALLRKQSEEAKNNVEMCAKTLQTTQEQHQKMFAEMQKALQTVVTQKSSKPQTMELSASTIQALAAMIQGAGSDGTSSKSLHAVASAPALATKCSSPSGPASPAPAGQPRSVRDFFDATNGCLQKLVAESNSKAEAAKSLSTLAMVLLNLLKDPSSEKNRKVNTSSSRFSEIFRNNSAAAKLLQLAGFNFQHPNFVFGDQAEQNTEDAQRTLELVQDAQRNLDQTWASRPEPQAVPLGEAAPAPGAAASASTPAPAPAAAPAAARPWARPSAAQQWASQARDIQSEEAAQASTSAGSSSAPPGPTPAHPAETLPPAIAHPAEAPGPAAPVPHLPNPTPPLLTGPPMQQQHMHLPIAHPAQAAAVVTAAHPAEGMSQPPAQPQPAAHPAETPQAAHPAESQNPLAAQAAHPAEAHAAHPAEVPMVHPAESTHAEIAAPVDSGASEEPQSGG